MPRPNALFGIDSDGINKLAESIARATGIQLHALDSPMDGRWYCSVSLAEMQSLLTAPKAAQVSFERSYLTLRPNDNGDPYYGGALHPGKGRFLLSIEAEAQDIKEVEAKLIRSGIDLICISRHSGRAIAAPALRTDGSRFSVKPIWARCRKAVKCFTSGRRKR